MKFLIQRVQKAQVSVHGNVVGEIQNGFLVFVGISKEDTEEIADKMVQKLLHLRIFEDKNGKTNLDLNTVQGELLIISQFTLYADCRHGNRPSFMLAGTPERAEELYQYIINKCKETVPVVQHGEFGAEMKVRLLNDGPFTVMLDSDELYTSK